MSKKYIGNGFVGNFANSQNIEISIPQLAAALGIDEKKFKAVFAEQFNAKTGKFKTPALYVRKFKTKDGKEISDLTLKISTTQRKDKENMLTVILNEYVPGQKTEQTNDVPLEDVDDMPF